MCPTSQPHTFRSTAIRRGILQPCVFAVVNCADVALNAFYSPVLTRCRIFLQLWTALSQETADNLCSVHYGDTLQPTTSKESACRILCAGTPENGDMAGAFPPPPFSKGCNGVAVPFHNSIIGNFMVYQDRLEINLPQLFGHSDSSEWFSIISVIIFEVNIVDEQKQT